ncbi:MAG: hypothetical protein KDC42_09730 [Ignavibacteriae bacterium]|nr:hypothetical protein [Ignavibacteriota bacterium]
MKFYVNSVYAAPVLFLLILCFNLQDVYSQTNQEYYLSVSRLTDPGEDAYLLKSLPDGVVDICNILNVQLVHYRMLSQWKIPKTEWSTAFSNYSIKSILDTLKSRGDSTLSPDRKLGDRIIGACTKESIFSTSALRGKGIPARMRVGYLTNLYTAEKTLDFWKNVKEYEWMDTTGEYPDEFTLEAMKVNRSIEHWVTEFWDESTNQWRLLDIRPEYINAYGKNVDYFIKHGENFEFAWEVWQRIGKEGIEEAAYAEGDLDAKSHVRYQMLQDFYSLLNYELPGVFDSDGVYIGDNENDDIKFLKKSYDDLSEIELKELDELAELLSTSPDVEVLVEFYNNSTTLKLESLEKDEYSFVNKLKSRN